MKKIFIVGSCVSRDAFALVNHNLHLSYYVARSSFASGFQAINPPEHLLGNTEAIESPFQKRMVVNDMTKGTIALLKKIQYDHIIIDFIDERFNLLDVDGCLFTISSEFLKTGIKVREHRQISACSDEHFGFWTVGIHRFFKHVDPRRVFLNKVFWSKSLTSGANFDGREKDIIRNNCYLDRLYQYIDSHFDCHHLTYDENELVADANHKWGVSPFHYHIGLYRKTIEQVNDLVESAPNNGYANQALS